MGNQKISKYTAITWLIKRVSDNPTGLSSAFAKEFNVSRTTASTFIKKQIAAGYLRKQGSTTRPSYGLGENRLISRGYRLPGIDESQAWVRDFRPYLGDLTGNVESICHYGFTEMLNNANDHSDGHRVWAVTEIENGIITIHVADDGIGIFKKISDTLGLSEKKYAFLELGKGKFTTDEKNHTGEGIFFTSKAFDGFSILANELLFGHRNLSEFDILRDIGWTRNGTSVLMEIPLDSPRLLREVFDKFTSNPEELNFDKTIIPVFLAKIGSENLISRSQAKRLLLRIDRFKYVQFDFEGIESIGQAFADEIFRVFQNDYPDITLLPENANTEVMRMINRVKSRV